MQPAVDKKLGMSLDDIISQAKSARTQPAKRATGNKTPITITGGGKASIRRKAPIQLNAKTAGGRRGAPITAGIAGKRQAIRAKKVVTPARRGGKAPVSLLPVKRLGGVNKGGNVRQTMAAKIVSKARTGAARNAATRALAPRGKKAAPKTLVQRSKPAPKALVQSTRQQQMTQGQRMRTQRNQRAPLGVPVQGGQQQGQGRRRGRGGRAPVSVVAPGRQPVVLNRTQGGVKKGGSQQAPILADKGNRRGGQRQRARSTAVAQQYQQAQGYGGYGGDYSSGYGDYSGGGYNDYSSGYGNYSGSSGYSYGAQQQYVQQAQQQRRGSRGGGGGGSAQRAPKSLAGGSGGQQQQQQRRRGGGGGGRQQQQQQGGGGGGRGASKARGGAAADGFKSFYDLYYNPSGNVNQF